MQVFSPILKAFHPKNQNARRIIKLTIIIELSTGAFLCSLLSGIGLNYRDFECIFIINKRIGAALDGDTICHE